MFFVKLLTVQLMIELWHQAAFPFIHGQLDRLQG